MNVCYAPTPEIDTSSLSRPRSGSREERKLGSCGRGADAYVFFCVSSFCLLLNALLTIAFADVFVVDVVGVITDHVVICFFSHSLVFHLLRRIIQFVVHQEPHVLNFPG